jgi:hypothetical protein
VWLHTREWDVGLEKQRSSSRVSRMLYNVSSTDRESTLHPSKQEWTFCTCDQNIFAHEVSRGLHSQLVFVSAHRASRELALCQGSTLKYRIFLLLVVRPRRLWHSNHAAEILYIVVVAVNTTLNTSGGLNKILELRIVLGKLDEQGVVHILDEGYIILHAFAAPSFHHALTRQLAAPRRFQRSQFHGAV